MTRHSFNAELDFNTSPKESTAAAYTKRPAGIGIEESSRRRAIHGRISAIIDG
jgi:hypothetical protein